MMKNKHREIGKKEKIEEIASPKQPKVRLQLMIPYHILMRIEKARNKGESVNTTIQNMIIIGLKEMEKLEEEREEDE